MARKKKERRIDMVAAAGGVGAVGGAASIRDPRKHMGKHLGGKPEDVEKLLSKAKQGDIVLTGRKSDFARLKSTDISRFGDRMFYRSLKSGTQSYTPHGMLVYGPKKAKSSILGKVPGTNVMTSRKSKHVMPTQIANQIENLERVSGGDVVGRYDRAVLLRPKKELTEPQKKLLSGFSTEQIKKKRPYDPKQAARQGALGTVLPKKVRDCFIGKKTKSNFCTGFPGEAMQRAGAPVVKGKGSAALAKDMIASKKLKAVGWAGSPISKLEKLKAVHAPRAVRALVYGAGAAGAAYGLSKAIGKFRGKKK